MCRAQVDRIVFDGQRAVGVEYRTSSALRRGEGTRHRALGGEILCCGGAINSPALLQLSGVGEAGALKALGIDVVADLPGVGENLQDHLEVYIQHACRQPVSMAPALKWRNRPWIGFQWLFFRKGPGATNHFEAGGFIRSNDDVAYPNVMFHFLPIAVRYDGTAPGGGHGYQVHVGPMYSDARGSVRITTDDPDVHPALRFNYLSTDQDRREWVEVVRAARTILAQPAFAPFDDGELSPGPAVETDEQILGWVATGRRDRPAPVLHVRHGHGTDERRRSAHDARARRRRPARGRRLGDAVRHQRQHLRARDDAGREGRGPHRRQHPPRHPNTSPTTATAR